jgi:hypothetical protein
LYPHCIAHDGARKGISCNLLEITPSILCFFRFSAMSANASFASSEARFHLQTAALDASYQNGAAPSAGPPTTQRLISRVHPISHQCLERIILAEAVNVGRLAQPCSLNQGRDHGRCLQPTQRTPLRVHGSAGCLPQLATLLLLLQASAPLLQRRRRVCPCICLQHS